MGRVTGLSLFPIKGVHRIEVNAADVEARGLKGDRRWLIVDSDMNFLSQREMPELAMVNAQLLDRGISISFRGSEAIEVETPRGECDRTVKVWNDECSAISAGDAAGSWLSDWLGRECHLVYMPENSMRQVHLDYALNNDIVSFADGFPLLLASDDSLNDLNGRLETPIPIHRFRPNVVVGGFGAYEEDEWKTIRIGEVLFGVVKKCLRCKVTTTDQETGVRESNEPLKTLASYRLDGSHVAFGQNLIPMSLGTIEVGELVEIVERA